VSWSLHTTSHLSNSRCDSIEFSVCSSRLPRIQTYEELDLNCDLCKAITFIRPTNHFPKCNECWTVLFFTSSSKFFGWPYTRLRWQMFRNPLESAVLYITTLHCCIRAKYIFIASNSLSTSTLYPVTYSFRFSFFSCCHV